MENALLSGVESGTNRAYPLAGPTVGKMCAAPGR